MAKIKHAQTEVKSLSKKSNFSEEKSVEVWNQKIAETEQANKDMEREIKLLKRL